LHRSPRAQIQRERERERERGGEMDGMQREELERLMFFEQTREKAAASYARNPKDADVFFFLSSFFFFLRNFLKNYVEDVNDDPHSFWRKKSNKSLDLVLFWS